MLFLLLFAFVMEAQTLSYSLLPADGQKPSARFDGPIAYEPSGGQIFLFGGRDTLPRNDLWAYSIADRRWTEIQPSGTLPPARSGHTLIFDAGRNRLVAFGGQASGFFSDVWAFDLTRRTWSRLSADDAGPTKRYGHSAVYEPGRGRMIISHGFTSAGRFDDTWAFNLAANTWNNLSPAGTRPLRRCLHHAVLDAAAGQMYLYGGCSSGSGPCPQGDLWSFDLATNTWTERTPQNNLPPREHYGMVFDAARSRLVVFGGNGNGLLNDTWEYNSLQGSWLMPTVSGPSPSARSRHESAYAMDRGASFFFGGSTASGSTNELWMLGAGAAVVRPEISQAGLGNVFSGVGGRVAPGEIVSLFGSGLGPLSGVALGFDGATGLLPTFGSGVAVSLNGQPAPLYFVSTGQINIQVPYEVSGSTEARLVVTVNGQASDTVTLPVVATKPGLVTRVWNQDGSINAPDNPALAGSVVVLYATGQGITNPASRTGAYPVGSFPEPVLPATVSIGGLTSEVLFRGQAPGTAGVMQLNVRLPEGITAGNGVPVVLTIGGVSSQAGVTIAVK